MESRVWRLPLKPNEVTDQTPVTDVAVNGFDNDYKDGFVPVGYATIVPCALKSHFNWQLKYNQPLVQVEENVSDLEEKTLSFKVIIYKGTSPGYANSPQRFVFIRESGYVSGGFHNTYMRYQDLVDRLGPNQIKFYEEDQANFEGTPKKSRQLPFPVWDQSGEAPDISQKFWSFKEFLESRSKTSAERNAQMFAFTCSWASAAMFPPKESFSTVMRFFDKPIADIQLHFRISPELADKNTVNPITYDGFKTLVKETVEEATAPPGQTQKRFLPTGECTLTTFSSSPPDSVWENNKLLLGSHPTGLYEIWTNKSSDDALKAASMRLPAYGFAARPGAWDVEFEPKSNKIKLLYEVKTPIPSTNSLLFDKTAKDFESETRITPLKIAAARNKDREPDQNTVMGSNSARSIAQKVWDFNASDKEIEWLHRSAFSYGGLEDFGSKSSQTVDNLILGTAATNTVMLRTEQFVKRYCQKQDIPVTVKTKVRWPDPIPEPLKCCSWLAPRIQYTIRTATNVTKPINRTMFFDTQARVTPLRFDFELGRKIEAAYYGWNDTATKDEYGDE